MRWAPTVLILALAWALACAQGNVEAGRRKLQGEDAVRGAVQFRSEGGIVITSTRPREGALSVGRADERLQRAAEVLDGSSDEACEACTDPTPATWTYSCAEQAARGNCRKNFVQRICPCSCANCAGRSGSTSDGGTQTGGSEAGPPAKNPKSITITRKSKSSKGSKKQKKASRSENEEDDEDNNCVDVEPPWSSFSCGQQANMQKCDRDWMRGYCLKACGKCAMQEQGEPSPLDDPSYANCPASCNNNPPNSAHSCEFQKTHGKCDRPWMKGHCECTCGTCPALIAQYEEELRQMESSTMEDPCSKKKGGALRRCRRKQKKAEEEADKAPKSTEGHTRFTILHFNDFHSRVEPANDVHGECSDYYQLEGRCHGGVARMKTAINEERAKAAARGEEVLLLNAGDDFAGTKWDHHYKGKAVAHFFKDLGIDAMTLGNHEFDYGPDVLGKYLQSLNYPVISSNMKSNGHWMGSFVQENIIKKVNGTKVGICGTTTQATMSWAHPWPVQFEDSTRKANDCIWNLKQKGVKIIILLSHEGLNADRYLGRKVAGMDLIIGGHSHSFLYNEVPPAISYHGGKPNRDHIWDTYPAWIDSWVEHGHRVPIVQAGWASRYLGVLVVEFDEGGNLVHIEGKPVLLGGPASDHPVHEDPVWKEEVSEWKYW